MELKPVETGPENKWPLNAEGVISSKLIGQALLMKGLIQRDMPITSIDRKRTRLNSIHITRYRMPASA